MTHRDRDTHAPYLDLVTSEDFLASHVVRVPAGATPLHNSIDISSFKENKNKAKQYSTLSGKTVVVKDIFVYSNKGMS